ncbi:hypothetical protein [Tenacibaculum sp.]|uniref:hypothetical protein n=1 Tax=Tenacibaculum sp. TaxID=1906242 RepID=UPI003D10329A
MKNILKLTCLLILLLISSCSKDSADDVTSNTNTYALLSSEIGTNDNGVIQLWKNGNITDITNKDSYSWGDNMVIENGDVYISGSEKEVGGSVQTVIWKNGVKLNSTTSAKTNLTNFGANQKNEEKLAVPTNAKLADFTVSGNNIYLLKDEFVDGISKIVMYKNGQPTNITNGSHRTTAVKIKVIGPDVYILGLEENESSTSVLKVWKNGQPTNLTDGTNFARADDIFITNNDVYVLGREYNGSYLKPKLWKNGVEIPNFISDQYFAPSSLFVENNNIYVAGTTIKNVRLAQLWKNGETINLGSSNLKHSYSSNVYVNDSKVYVSFSEQNQDDIFVSKLWIDGEITDLSDGKTNSFIQKVVVK